MIEFAAAAVDAFMGFAAVMNTIFAAAVGITATALAGMAIYDKVQRKDATRHNFPIVGRPAFIRALDWMGKFARNHFLENDRQEKPFSRAQREAVYSLAEGKKNIDSFGSTKDRELTGTYSFPNATFFQETHTKPIVIGPYSKNPYTARSIFNISAMSYGALSKPAVRGLSLGAAKAGCWLDTGEGGLAPAHLEGNCDLVFEMGTAKFGVRDAEGNLDEDKLRAIAAHESVKMISIKLAQGAKPGEGGVLPGRKVTPEIAEIRGIPVGQDAISPDSHKEIRNVSELMDFIERVRGVTEKPVGFKAVYSRRQDVVDLCREIKKRGIESAPDFIVIDGNEGGTGAGPRSLMDNVGISIRNMIPMVAETLIEYELKDRIRLVAAGKLIEPGDVAWALAMGADFVNSARGFLFAMKCVQAKRCHKDTCPSGLTTQNPSLQKGFDAVAMADRVANYDIGLVKEVEKIAHTAGLADPRDFRPHHVLRKDDNGKDVPMSDLYPKLQF